MDDADIFETAPRTPGSLREVALRPDGYLATFDHARLQVEAVSPGIARLRLTESDFAPPRSWDVLETGLPAAEPNVTGQGGGAVLELDGMRVALDGVSGTFAVGGVDGASWLEQAAPARWAGARLDRLGIPHLEGDALPPGRDGVLLRQPLRLDPADRLWGFGQRTGGLDRRGRSLTHWTSDSFGIGHHRGTDNLYQAQPVFLAVQPGRAFGAFLHVSHFSRVDAGYADPDVLRIDALGGELDLFLFAGPTPAAVVEQLTRLTGRPLLPPHWALGFHQSRWGYASAEEIVELVATFRRRGLPLDAVHLDIDYMRGFRSFTWDPAGFPDPKAFTDAVHDRGARVVTIIDPGIKDEPGAGYAVADELLTHGYALRNDDGSPFRGYVWPERALFPDFTRAEVRAWWGEQHEDSLVAAGVDGVWNDMNEPTVFDRPFATGAARNRPFPLRVRHGGAEERASHLEVRNLYATLEGRATYDALARYAPEARPWVLTRSAYPGSQRSCATWMGDNNSWWEHLALSVPQLLSMGLSGSPHAGADIGGFFENGQPELFARWMELGAFYPFMRDHTAAGTRAQEPWAFGEEVEAAARAALELRYRLLPYLVTLAHEAASTGAPLLRPLGYEFIEEEGTLDVDDAFMLGRWLLVAPVTTPRSRWRQVVLPPGRCLDVWTGRPVADACLAEVRPAIVEAPLGRPPLLLREGALVPLGDVRPSTATPLAELRIVVAAPAAESAYEVVEDDGRSRAWEDGVLARTPLSSALRDGELTVRVGPREGRFEPAPRRLVVELRLGARPERVALDGAEVDARWDAARSAAEIAWDDDGSERVVTVRMPSEA
ncbi:MAG: glycoside hydrolase family 31 protein [Deinococcales bacterium]